MNLLQQCRIETYRASGPGGQKRNKTSSAVRITHVPTRVQATAADSRSQHDNRRRALDRLRLALALQVRQEFAPASPPPAWWNQIIDPSGHIRMSRRNPVYCPAIAHVLDVLDAAGGSLADAARALGTNTSNLVDTLADDALVWAATQHLRQRHGLPTLLNPQKS